MATANSISEAIDRSMKWLWETDTTTVPAWQRLLLRTLRIAFAVVRDLKDGQLSLRAMSLVYTTVIAIVPLLALSFSVLKGFDMHNRVEPALLEGLHALGDKRFEIVAKVLEFVDNVKVGVLGAVGFALLIYSVISMMHKIENSFNFTWQIKRDRTMSQRFRDYLSVIFVGPLLILLSVGITTSVNTEGAVTLIAALPMGSSVISTVSAVVPYLIMAFGFAIIYVFLPNTRVNLTAAFVGGLVTAIFWKMMGWGISTFVANSSNNLAVYSAFASIIVLMVWMYVGWLVLLVGASVAFYFQNPQYILVRRDNVQLSGENRERLAINILYYVYQSYQQTAPPWHVDSLGRQLQVAPHVVDDMVEFLVEHGYLVKTGDESVNLFPKRPLEQVTVAGVLLKVRELELDSSFKHSIIGEPAVNNVFIELSADIERQFAGKTFATLLQEEA